jgi:hypothetical protein
VKSDHLVTENVVSWGEGGWDGDGPGHVVGHELIGSPGSWGSGVVDDTLLGDLEELEGGFVDGSTVTGALGHVVDDWSLVGFWPCVPFHSDGSSSGNGGAQLCVGGISVADDIASAESGWSDETKISGRFGPSNDCWWRGSVWVLVDEVTSEAGDC